MWRDKGRPGPTLQVAPAAPDGPALPLLTYSCAPPSSLACINVRLLGTWPSPGPWPDTPHGPQGPAPLGGVPGPRAGDKHRREERGPAGRLERECVSQQAADRQQRPLLAGSLLAHLAEQRQWWLPLQPSLLPTGRAPGSVSVRNLPQSPAGRQPEGSTRGLPSTGRAAKLPRVSWQGGRGCRVAGRRPLPANEMQRMGCAGGSQPSTWPSQLSDKLLPREPPEGMTPPLAPQPLSGSQPQEPPSLLWGNKGPLFPGLSTELWRPQPLSALTAHHWLCSDD